jgi:hypothetical protein
LSIYQAEPLHKKNESSRTIAQKNESTIVIVMAVAANDISEQTAIENNTHSK